MSNLLKVKGVAFVAAMTFLMLPVAAILAGQVKAAAPALTVNTPVATPGKDSTPTYIFNSDQAGVIVYHGPCAGDLLYAVAGANTVTFSALADGTYATCSIVVVNSLGQFSGALAVASFVVDTHAPVLTLVTAVPTPTNDTTPPFTFYTTEAGTTVYAGSCVSADTSAALGSNTNDYATLVSGTYTNCTVKVRDAALNESNVLAMPSFTVEAAASVTLDTIGTATSTSPAVASAKIVNLVASAAGTLSIDASGPQCAITPTTIGTSQSAFTVYDLVDSVNYNTAGKCVIKLTTPAGNTVLKDLLGQAIGTPTDATAPSVAPGAVTIEANGAYVDFTVNINEGGTYAIADDAGDAGACSGVLTALTGTVAPGTASKVVIGPIGTNGTYSVDGVSRCLLVVTDASTNAAAGVIIPSFTVADASGPTLTLVTGPQTSTYTAAPALVTVVVKSDEPVTTATTASGNLNFGGACGGVTASVTAPGAGTITKDINTTVVLSFALGTQATYSSCQVRLRDAGSNYGSYLTLPTFSVDNKAPVLTLVQSPLATGPNPAVVVFTSTEAGTGVIAGGCLVGGLATGLPIVSGTNTVTFDTATAGTLTCTITPTDALGTAGSAMAVTAFTITDAADPTVTGAVVNPATMVLTFTSSEEGTIAFSATSYCSSKQILVHTGANTIQLNAIPAGLVVDACEFTVTEGDGAATKTVSLPSFTATSAAPGTVWRFFNKKNGAHLYTISTNERDTVMTLTSEWTYEGPKFLVWETQATGTVPVYRFWNRNNGAHLYTIDEGEKTTIQTTLPQFVFEGIKFYVKPVADVGVVPVYRFFNRTNGAHVYTVSETEKATIMTLANFNYEGIKYYVQSL